MACFLAKSINTCILKAHSHALTLWRFNLSFLWVSLLFLNSWKTSDHTIRYDTNPPCSYSKTQGKLRLDVHSLSVSTSELLDYMRNCVAVKCSLSTIYLSVSTCANLPISGISSETEAVIWTFSITAFRINITWVDALWTFVDIWKTKISYILSFISCCELSLKIVLCSIAFTKVVLIRQHIESVGLMITNIIYLFHRYFLRIPSYIDS